MKRSLRKKKENSIDVMAIEHDLNPQIYDHLNSIIKLDINGNLITYNQAFTKQYGYTEQDFNKPFLDVFIKGDKLEHKHYFEHTILGQEQNFDAIALCKNGKEVEINVTLIPINTKMVKDVFVIAKNIAESKKQQKEMLLFQKKQHIFNELENICDFYYDAINDLHYYSNQFPLIFGIDEGQGSSPTLNNLLQYVYFGDRPTVNNTIQDAIRNRTGYQLEYRILRKDQTVRYVFEQAEILLDQNGQLDGFIGFIQDITKRKKAEDLNKYLAYHDPLTDLPNRRLFQDKLEQTLEISKTLQQKLAVILLDLDRFKYVNDTLGHPVGDKLLKQISTRLTKNLRDQDVLARFGGDEFAVLLPNIENTTEAIEYSKTIIKLLEEAFHIENYELFITTSIGISIFPIDGEETETLIKHADSALYRAKDKGKNTYQIYTPSMDIESYKIFSLETDLRKALELNQFELYYQPKICATDNQIMGAEALIRWNHPQWGLVSPIEFIPLAEETGIILEIGKWIKFTTCTQIYTWQKAGLPVVPISINLSAHRFSEKDLLIHLKEILTQTMLDPKYLEIEITETFLLENERIVFSILDEIRTMGIRISLDDFGTGYTSLSYLKRFKGRIDTLKIDRSFISGLSQTGEEDINFITEMIIRLAQHLKMDVVAEGVETIEQLEILKEFNCNTIQGYLFSKPVPADVFAALLKKGKIEKPIVSK